MRPGKGNLKELGEKLVDDSNSVTSDILTDVIDMIYIPLGHCQVVEPSATTRRFRLRSPFERALT